MNEEWESTPFLWWLFATCFNRSAGFSSLQEVQLFIATLHNIKDKTLDDNGTVDLRKEVVFEVLLIHNRNDHIVGDTHHKGGFIREN